MQTVLDELVDYLQELTTERSPKPNLYFIGISGVPGAGKTSLASYLASRVPRTSVVSMDGYHYPRATLATFPNADEAFRRRGAPFTFDSERFARDVKTLRSAGEFTFPAFDHAAKDPVEAAVHVSSGSSKVVLFEGLYLFLESDPGFRRVCHMLDERWFIAADVDDAMARLAERHVRTGVAASLEEAKARVDANDRPNAELVDAQCRPSATRLIWSVHDEDFDTWKVE